MRVSQLSFGLATLVLTGLGCEPAQPPVAPTQPAATTPTAPATVASSAYDLSPVAEPADLVGLLRWRTPSATISTMGGCANLPQELLRAGPTAFLSEMFGDVLRGDANAKKLAAIVATEASVDLVVALDPTSRRGEPIFAFSMGLTSIDGAKDAISANGALPAEIVPGVWRVGSDKEGRRDLSCVVAVSTGPTPARLVCGRRDKWVTALVPYMTRTLPTAAPATTDLHGEVRYAPVDARYGDMIRSYAQGLPVLAKSQASIGEPAFDAALNDAAVALSDEAISLTRDLDRLTIDLSSDPTTCLTASGALKLRDKSSWIAGSILDRADRAGPPPAIFWRAPKDSDSVSFGRAGDPARMAGIIRTLRTMVDGALGKFQIGSADDRKALADLIAAPIGKDTNTVSASGHGASPPAKPKAATKPGDDPPRQTVQQKVDDVVTNLGWTLIGFDQPPDAIAKWLKDVVAVYGRKGLIDPVKKALRQEARFLPTIKVVGAPASLGKDAFAVEIKGDFLSEVPPAPPKIKAGPAGGGSKKPPEPVSKLPPPPKPEKVTFTLHIVLMPDATSTWIAFGPNKDELVKHLLMAKTGAPTEATLATRPGLESLRAGKNMSGGFFTLALFSKLLRLGDSGRRAGREDPLSAIKDTPHGGATPIFFTSTVTPGNAPKTELTVKLSKDSVEDLVTVLTMTRKRNASIATEMPAAPAPALPPPPGKR
jgi:hypothetical protein